MAIKRQILEIFRTETFEKNKLPSEATLAARLGISLVTLREALLMLALEGYITKRHGSGNYVHPSTLDYENRSYYFVDCLRKDGYRTEIKLLRQGFVEADAEATAALHLEPGEMLLRHEILYLADNKPAVLTVGKIPASIVLRRDIENMDFSYIHVLIHDFCQKDLAHSLNEYLPMATTEALATLFELPVGTPIIASKQVFYDIYDLPILYNTHYFYPDRYKVKILQNWDLGR